MRIPLLAYAHMGYKPDYSPEFKTTHNLWNFISDDMLKHTSNGRFGSECSYYPYSFLIKAKTATELERFYSTK